MSSLDVVISAFAALQKNRLKSKISSLTTVDGRITIPAIDFMSFAGVVDVALVKFYVNFIKRDKFAIGFRSLLNLDWGTSPGGINCKPSFDLTTSLAKLQQLDKRDVIPIITPSAASASSMMYENCDIGSALKINDVIESESNQNVAENFGVTDDIAVSDSIQNKEVLKGIDEKVPMNKKRRRSKKLYYEESTLAKYASDLERNILDLIKSKDLSGNENLQNQLLQEVLRRLAKRVGINEVTDVTQKLVSNMKNLVTDMRRFGNNDIEQIRFLEGLALSVSGHLSVAKIMSFTGLSKRSLEYGKEMRKGFDQESVKAVEEIETNIVSNNDDAHDDSNIRSECEVTSETINQAEASDDTLSDTETIYSEESDDIENEGRKRAKRGEGKSKAKINRYRLYISRKFRKTRCDQITGVEIQRFCHESQWGGRLDTLKLSKQQIVIEQPLGGYEYESIKSYQYTVPEMYKHFKETEYGHRQRMCNNGRDLSLRRFRELICPCMTQAKQRDTADEIVAEFKQCLLTWDISMRKKDRNVMQSIEKCSNTECAQHKKNTASAALYAMASKSPSHFMKYLMCPQIQRDELAVKVSDGQDLYSAKLEVIKAENIAVLVDKKAKRDLNYWASGAKKGMRLNQI